MMSDMERAAHYLLDIIQSLEKISDFLNGITAEEFSADE